MAAEGAGKGLVMFEDVAIYFSPEEWELLTGWQRDLYQEVMEDNFELVAWLGSQMHPRPEPLCRMAQGEEPCAVDLPRQGGEDARGTSLPAAQSPSVQDPAIKEEFSGRWSPLAAPESRALGAEFGSLQACPSRSESKLPDVGGASPGPPEWEGDGGSPEQALLLICECGRSFEDGASLREHQALHKEEKGPFACTACGKLFQYRLNLLTHKKHRGKKPHPPCAQCGLRFCLKGDLLRHRASHAAEGLHPCRECGLLFRRKRHLLAHQAEHGGETPHRCPTCGTAFGSQAELAGHQRSHQEERPFRCARCGESFSWLESLQVHQRTHAQEKRGHACPVCGRTFSRQGNLLTHQRLHTGELPFPCPECDRSFPSRTSLVVHSRSHQRRRPFGSRDKLGEPHTAHSAQEGPIKQEAEL